MRSVRKRVKDMVGKIDGFRLRNEFRSVQSYAMFVGYPRSGHTLVGALLNAHPNILMAHEANVIRFVRRRASRSEIFAFLLRHNARFIAGGSKWEGYSYAVPGQWQAQCRELRVIGDKKGGLSAMRILERPELYTRLRETVRVPLRVIHIPRNPFDNISTIAKRDNSTIAQAIARYRRHVEGVEVTLRMTAPEHFITIGYEEFVADPKRRLTELCEFLGESATDEYLVACAGLVFPVPSRTREKLAWTAAEEAQVNRMIEEVDFLHARYSSATAPMNA